MKKIAIIKTHERSINYDDSETFVTSITDWAEVTEEVYNILRASSTINKFIVVEQPRNQLEFIGKTVEDYRIYIEKVEKERAELIAKKKFEREEKIRLSNLSEKERKLELLKKLQAEYEAGQL